MYGKFQCGLFVVSRRWKNTQGVHIELKRISLVLIIAVVLIVLIVAVIVSHTQHEVVLDMNYELAEKRCVEQGGEWTWGEAYWCKMPVGDEGKQCTDSSQCEDICRTETFDGNEGVCTTFSGGCDYVLDDGDVHAICG